MIQEINFDGIIGPTHNYAGLSPGNIASARNAGQIAQPRAAALQGVEKMRRNMALGLAQGFFVPLDRPDTSWLAMLGTNIMHADAHIRAQAYSASSMWAANAATVSPASDTLDGKCHLTVANLLTMPHRSHEWQGTLRQLQCAFANPNFVVHAPIPAPFGDEGAANHMRLCIAHDQAGVEIFVYGVLAGRFPARQSIEASKAIARNHGLNPDKTLLIRQSDEAIAAGAFHNDVVAVANEQVLFTHERAFQNPTLAYQKIRDAFPNVQIITVPAADVSLQDAISSYLFNAQLVSLPEGGMGLVLPTEAQENRSVWSWLQRHVQQGSPITRLLPVDVRQSMANGGGPACLRLRVVADPRTIDPRFIANDKVLGQIEGIISTHWPQEISPDDLSSPALMEQVRRARHALLDVLNLQNLA